METLAFQEAYDQIVAYIKTNGGTYNKWYVGVASDAGTRLFSDHKVSSVDDAWIHRTCKSDGCARQVAEELLRLGCEGEKGDGEERTTQVYAYKKTGSTVP